MAAPHDETSFLSQVLGWTAGGIAAVGVWLWTTTMGRISALEKEKVSQRTFDEYVARADKDRDERRDTELALFNEIKDQRQHFDSKLDRLADLIRAQR